MDVIPLSHSLHDAWDDACWRSDDAWFWHTTTALEYQKLYRPELGARSLSFMVTDGNEVLAVCPLFSEQAELSADERELTIGGTFGLPPAITTGISTRRRETIRELCFQQIGELARANDIVRAQLRIPPLTPTSLSKECEENVLARYGFLDVSLSSQLIDLDKTDEQLLADMRKGHRNDIKRGSATLETMVLDSKNLTESVYSEYHNLHRRAAGRETRSQETWDLMFDWIEAGSGILVAARHDDRFVGFSYVNLYKNGAYYASACNEPELRNLPISHVLQWTTMRWLRDNGIRYYEVGIQQFGPQLYDFPSEKEISIAHFKRGFGGVTVPFFRGEKYWSSAYLRRVYEDRVSRIAGSLDGGS